MTTTNLADLPAPAGAVSVDPWRDDGDGTGPYRYFQGSLWIVERPDQNDEDVGIMIAGFQQPATGGIERWISVDAAGQLTPAQAHQLARHLTSAAAEVENYDQIKVAR